jgi:2-C-methyl-D-erythritol 4-phosphate cytidylyltransferase
MNTYAAILVTAPPPGQSESGAQLKVDGKECILRATELFVSRDGVKQTLVTFDSAEQDKVKQKYGGHFAFAGVKLAFATGKWIDHLAAAADKLDASVTHVLIHDGARCCVPYTDLEALTLAAEKAKGPVALALPVRGQLIELDESGTPVGNADAARYHILITPMVLPRDEFLAMVKTRREPHASKLTLVKASPLNLRMNTPADERQIKSTLATLPKPVKLNDGPFGEAQW